MKKDLSILAVLLVIIVGGAILFNGPDGTDLSGEDTNPTPQEGSVRLKLGQSANIQGLMITPRSMVDDSRCPTGVECVWAGTVRVNTEIFSGLGTSNQVIEINKSITTEAEEVTLTEVTPYPKAGSTINSADYRITYSVKKREAPQGGGRCYVGGCSSQLCTDEPGMVSTCEYTAAYACYKGAKCERQTNGQCGWTQTESLKMCLDNARDGELVY